MVSSRSGSRAAACMAIRPGMATIMPWMQLKDANLSAIPLGTTPSERKLSTL
jgi:hypothetical protein